MLQFFVINLKYDSILSVEKIYLISREYIIIETGMFHPVQYNVLQPKFLENSMFNKSTIKSIKKHHGIKIKLLLYTLTASLCTIIVSCGSFIPENESWEGIQDTSLRVFIQYDFTYDVVEKNRISLNQLLLDAGKSRAEAILLSYIRVHVTDAYRIIACQQQIEGIIAKGTMYHWNCNNEFCTAYIDFDIREFLKTAGTDRQK